MTMRGWKRRWPVAGLSPALAWTISVLLSSILAAPVLAADAPRFIGRTSCATATCHGGIVGVGPAWHSSSSVFESSDPHTRAGEVLRNDLSMRIVSALEPRALKSEEVFLNTLQARCVSCHAPEGLAGASPSSAAVESKRIRTSLAAGVSCEACHGPASGWEKQHTREDWAHSQRFSPATGMLDTESPLARTDNCTRCHVGSRSADGQVRDMNHDMIAAGHPALYFDMLRYQSRLPSHWAGDADALVRTPPKRLLKTAEALQTRVLLAAVRLSEERRAESTHSPQPELSEYDCAACHHALEWNSPRQRRAHGGSALWQPWYTAGRQLQVPRDELRLDRSDIDRMLHALPEPVKQRSEALLQAPESAPRSDLKLLLSAGGPDPRSDYCGAAAWLDQVEIAGRAVALDEARELPEQFDQLIFLFRQRVLGYRQGVPTALESLMPRAWDDRDIENLRKQLSLCIAPVEPRGRP